jgi:hypothetical protein
MALPVLAASGADQADKVAQKMLDFDKALGQASAQIDATLTTMNSMNGASGSDLSSKYKDFGKQVKKLEDMSNKAKAQAQKSNEQRDEYLKDWQASQANIQNEQLKAASEARRNELMPKIEAIKNSLGAARDAFTPFMQNLKDLNTYFANNLTPQGMTGASDLMGKVSAAGNTVKENIGKGQDAIKDLASSISPKAAPEKK